MISKDNIEEILLSPNFSFKKNNNLYSKKFGSDSEGFKISYNSETGDFIYPIGLEADRNTTIDEHQDESFVVFLCVAQLFDRGYLPHHIKLEGRNYSGSKLGWCDILVKDNKGIEYLIIECKTADIVKKDDQFRQHWQKTLRNGDQLFRYFNTYRRAKYLCFFAADYPEYNKDGKKSNRFENVYHIISLVDNEAYLKTNSSLKSFKTLREEQGTSEDFFDVWKNTYMQDYNTRGLLELGIEPFNIGNKSYGLSDLKTVDEYSLEKKYHEFALILRKYTISSHENAFDKLINLFIAKIIDETTYKNEEGLKLLWKGAAYDDYFSLQDRLNILYLIGMKKFFNDDVAYVENKQIEDAFKFLSSNADEGKETIKKYFRKLKYFNNNPFAFLDVHNEVLFYKNAIILKDVINMLQDIYLTSNKDNQFLGDLFEGFLNKGIHQSEGQFFTPIPVVRFLVSSLPLRRIIESNKSIPKVIDYACGSGHFLTEYARQIMPIVSTSKSIEVDDDNYIGLLKEAIKPYYDQIEGIEKDYRLSKVSQVAVYMYGMDGIHIHYSDALVDISNVKNHTYDVLVANPPYSVSGFLETLTEEERNNYTLSAYVSNIEKNNSIETFFIERAEQLLNSEGVATIILPSSVLSKGGLFMRSREIILKYFNIVSICCFGPNTFGQTNTNTIALFLQRKALEPDTSVHYKNRVDAWFSGNLDDDYYFEDYQLLDAYISKMGYNYDDYVELLNGKLTDSLRSNEIIEDYLLALNIPKRGNDKVYKSIPDKAKKIKENAKKIIERKVFKKLPDSEKEEFYIKTTIDFIREIEKEKLYYYLLASDNAQQVLIVDCPTTKNEEKDFLGYEWSNRKGAEGIHYLNTGKIKNSDSDDESADDVTLQQIKGVNGIQTPMFDPMDLFNDSKINNYIRCNFDNQDFDIAEENAEFINLYALTDLIDFSRVEFDKVIKTKAILEYPKIETNIEDKEKLKKCAPFVTEKVSLPEIDISTYVTTDNMLKDRGGVQSYEGIPNVARVTKYMPGDILVSNIRPYLRKIWLADKEGGCSNDVLVFRNICEQKILNGYLYAILSTDTFFDFMMTGKTGLKMPRGDKKIIPSFEIPIPSKEIQIVIAKEFQKIESKVSENRAQIMKLKNDIKILANGIKATPVPLSSLYEKMQNGANIKQRRRAKGLPITRIETISNGKLDRSRMGYADIVSPDKYEKYLLANGDILFSHINSHKHVGKCAICRDIEGSEIIIHGMNLLCIRVNKKVLPDYLYLYFLSDNFKNSIEPYIIDAVNQSSINTTNLSNVLIPLPSPDEQNSLVKQLINIEDRIVEAENYIENSTFLKQELLDRYLNG